MRALCVRRDGRPGGGVAGLGADGFTMKPRKGRLGPGLSIALFVLAVDQVTKFWLVGWVMSPPRVIEVLPVFNLVMVWNEGVSFGLFGDGTVGPYLLSGLAFAVALAMLLWLRKAETTMLGLGLGAVIGGAVGNAIDRLHWGAVADFFDLHVAGWHWPAFNVADMAITAGVILVLADGLFASPKSLK